MYSSQEIVLGAGAVRDCRLTGWAQQSNQSVLLTHSHQGTITMYNSIKPEQGFVSLLPQNSVHWCCLLYSSSPWLLCSSRCPPRSGVLAVYVTRAPDRSLSRSQPGSFQPSPAQKTSICLLGFHRELPFELRNTTADCAKVQPEGRTVLTFQDTKALN